MTFPELDNLLDIPESPKLSDLDNTLLLYVAIVSRYHGESLPYVMAQSTLITEIARLVHANGSRASASVGHARQVRSVQVLLGAYDWSHNDGGGRGKILVQFLRARHAKISACRAPTLIRYTSFTTFCYSTVTSTIPFSDPIVNGESCLPVSVIPLLSNARM